jgi:hypothetical protein
MMIEEEETDLDMDGWHMWCEIDHEIRRFGDIWIMWEEKVHFVLETSSQTHLKLLMNWKSEFDKENARIEGMTIENFQHEELNPELLDENRFC